MYNFLSKRKSNRTLPAIVNNIKRRRKNAKAARKQRKYNRIHAAMAAILVIVASISCHAQSIIYPNTTTALGRVELKLPDSICTGLFFNPWTIDSHWQVGDLMYHADSAGAIVAVNNVVFTVTQLDPTPSIVLDDNTVYKINNVWLPFTTTSSDSMFYDTNGFKCHRYVAIMSLSIADTFKLRIKIAAPSPNKPRTLSASCGVYTEYTLSDTTLIPSKTGRELDYTIDYDDVVRGRVYTQYECGWGYVFSTKPIRQLHNRSITFDDGRHQAVLFDDGTVKVDGEVFGVSKDYYLRLYQWLENIRDASNGTDLNLIYGRQ